MIKDLVDAMKAHARDFVEKLRPTTITLSHPSDHPLAGQPAAFLVRKEPGGGAAQYDVVPAPGYVPNLQPVQSELMINHEFDSLGSFRDYLNAKDVDGANTLFLSGVAGDDSNLTAVVEVAPEVGSLNVAFGRHPVFCAWESMIGKGPVATLSHGQIADLLDEQQESLADPTLVRFLLRLRAAKQVTYDGKMDDGKTQTVTAAWKVESEGVGNIIIPRAFTVNMPAFVGAWDQGKEPTFPAQVRLRVIPPKRGDESAMPQFSLCWVNFAQWEIEATEALRKRVAEVMTPRPVFNATPKISKRSACASGLITKFNDVTG